MATLFPWSIFWSNRGSIPRGLCHSAEAGNLKVARLVLELGANVNERDDDGFTPLDYCTGLAHTWQFKSGQNHPKIEAFLRKHDAVHGSELNVS